MSWWKKILTLFLIVALLTNEVAFAFSLPFKNLLAQNSTDNQQDVSNDFTVHIVGESTSYFVAREAGTGIAGYLCNVFENNFGESVYKIENNKTEYASVLKKLEDFYSTNGNKGCETVWPQIRVIFEANTTTQNLSKFINEKLQKIQLTLKLNVRDTNLSIQERQFTFNIPTTSSADYRSLTSDTIVTINNNASTSPGSFFRIIPFPSSSTSIAPRELEAFQSSDNNKSYFGFWIVIRSQYYFRDDLNISVSDLRKNQSHQDYNKYFKIEDIKFVIKENNTITTTQPLTINLYDDPADYRDKKISEEFKNKTSVTGYFPTFIETLPPLSPEASVLSECSYIQKGGLNILDPVNISWRQELFQFNYNCNQPPEINDSNQFVSPSTSLCFKTTDKSFPCTVESISGAKATSSCAYGLAFKHKFDNAYIIHPDKEILKLQDQNEKEAKIQEFVSNLFINPGQFLENTQNLEKYLTPVFDEKNRKDYRILKKINTSSGILNLSDSKYVDQLLKKRLFTDSFLFSTSSLNYSYLQLNSRFPVIEECEEDFNLIPEYGNSGEFKYSYFQASGGLAKSCKNFKSNYKDFNNFYSLFENQKINKNITGGVSLVYKRFPTLFGEVGVYLVKFTAPDANIIEDVDILDPTRGNIVFSSTIQEDTLTKRSYLLISLPPALIEKLQDSKQLQNNITAIYLNGKLFVPQKNIWADGNEVTYSVPENVATTTEISFEELNGGFDILILLKFKDFDLSSNPNSLYKIFKHDFRFNSNVPHVYTPDPITYIYEFNSSFSLRNKLDIRRYLLPSWQRPGMIYSFGTFAEFTSECTLPQFGFEPQVVVSSTQLSTQVRYFECKSFPEVRDIGSNRSQCQEKIVNIPSQMCWGTSPLQVGVLLKKQYEFPDNEEEKQKILFDYFTTALEFRNKGQNIQGFSFELIQVSKDKENNYQVEIPPKILGRIVYNTRALSDKIYQQAVDFLANSTNDTIAQMAQDAKNLGQVQEIARTFIDNLVAYFPLYLGKDKSNTAKNIDTNEAPQEVKITLDPTVAVEVVKHKIPIFYILASIVNTIAEIIKYIPGVNVVYPYLKAVALVLYITSIAVGETKLTLWTAIQLAINVVATANQFVNLSNVLDKIPPAISQGVQFTVNIAREVYNYFSYFMGIRDIYELFQEVFGSSQPKQQIEEVKKSYENTPIVKTPYPLEVKVTYEYFLTTDESRMLMMCAGEQKIFGCTFKPQIKERVVITINEVKEFSDKQSTMSREKSIVSSESDCKATCDPNWEPSPNQISPPHLDKSFVQKIKSIGSKIIGALNTIANIIKTVELIKAWKNANKEESYIKSFSMNFGYYFENLFNITKDTQNPENNIMWLRMGVIGKKVYDPDYPEFGFYQPVRYFYSPTTSIIDLNDCSFVSCNFVSSSTFSGIRFDYTENGSYRPSSYIGYNFNGSIIYDLGEEHRQKLNQIYNFENIYISLTPLHCNFGFNRSDFPTTTTTNKATTTFSDNSLSPFIIASTLWGNYNGLLSASGTIKYFTQKPFILPQYPKADPSNFNNIFLLFATVTDYSLPREEINERNEQILTLNTITYTSTNVYFSQSYSPQCQGGGSTVDIKYMIDISKVVNFMVQCPSNMKPVYYGDNASRPTCLGWRCEFLPSYQPSLTSTLPTK